MTNLNEGKFSHGGICRTIEQFHEAAARSGKQVDVLRLTDSDHVEHFKKYPAEYRAVVRRFLSSLERL